MDRVEKYLLKRKLSKLFEDLGELYFDMLDSPCWRDEEKIINDRNIIMESIIKVLKELRLRS